MKPVYGSRMSKRSSAPGVARAKALTPERRSEIARKGAAARTVVMKRRRLAREIGADAATAIMALVSPSGIIPYAPPAPPPPAIRGAHTDLNIEILLRGLDRLGFRASQRSVFAEQVMCGESMYGQILEAMRAPKDVGMVRFLGIPMMLDETIAPNQVRFVFHGNVTFMLDF